MFRLLMRYSSNFCQITIMRAISFFLPTLYRVYRITERYSFKFKIAITFCSNLTALTLRAVKPFRAVR